MSVVPFEDHPLNITDHVLIQDGLRCSGGAVYIYELHITDNLVIVLVSLLSQI